MIDNQKGFVIPLIITIIALLIIGGGTYIYVKKFPNSNATTTVTNIVGNDKDEHGCISSAGYSWCEEKNKCLRIWEEKCETATSTPSDKYSTDPISECVSCVNGKTWDNKPCCTDDFEKDCTSNNGVVRFSDLHPVFTWILGCFQKAPDTGKACSVATDCLSGVCDLESAIKSNKCILINKEFTGEKNRFNNSQEFYIATYSCNTTKPGVCAETITSKNNPGGANHTFKMDDKTLIEILESGPIY